LLRIDAAVLEEREKQRHGSVFDKFSEHAGTIETPSNCIGVLFASRRTGARAAFEEQTMRYMLLWILGVPIPVLILIWLLWGH
jgi:hypothetical protein